MNNLTSKQIILWTIISAIVLGALSATLGITILIIGGFVYWKKHNGSKKKENLETLANQARALVEDIRQHKRLQEVSTSAFLERGEHAFIEEHAALYETRAVRETSGAGVGFRVMKGVSVGGYKGRSESHQELRQLDSGIVTLTNKKIIFRGAKENRTIPLENIVGMKRYNDAIEIASTGRQKGSSFSVNNPYAWNVIFYVLRNVENPLDFSQIKDIDIRIE